MSSESVLIESGIIIIITLIVIIINQKLMTVPGPSLRDRRYDQGVRSENFVRTVRRERSVVPGGGRGSRSMSFFYLLN